MYDKLVNEHISHNRWQHPRKKSKVTNILLFYIILMWLFLWRLRIKHTFKFRNVVETQNSIQFGNNRWQHRSNLNRKCNSVFCSNEIAPILSTSHGKQTFKFLNIITVH